MTMWTSQRIHRFYQPGLSPRFQKLCIFVQKRPPGHSNCSYSIYPYTHSTTLQNRKSPIITEIDASCAQFPANTYVIAWARWFKRFTTTYACPAVSSNFKGSKSQPTKSSWDPYLHRLPAQMDFRQKLTVEYKTSPNQAIIDCPNWPSFCLTKTPSSRCFQPAYCCTEPPTPPKTDMEAEHVLRGRKLTLTNSTKSRNVTITRKHSDTGCTWVETKIKLKPAFCLLEKGETSTKNTNFLKFHSFVLGKIALSLPTTQAKNLFRWIKVLLSQSALVARDLVWLACYGPEAGTVPVANAHLTKVRVKL